MPIIAIFASIARAIAAGYAAVSDTFTRTTAGSLGTSSSGAVWRAIRGTWYSNATVGQSDDAASTYPIAAVDMASSNVTVSTSVSAGTGVAYWVTDANNWYATTARTSVSTYNYSCGSCYTCQSCGCGCSAYNSCVNSNCSCATYNPCQSCTYCGSTCSSGVLCDGNSTCRSGSCSGSIIGTPTCSSCPNSTCSCATYNSCPDASCGCATCATCTDCFYCGQPTCVGYNYAYKMRMFRSVSGTVSDLVSEVALSGQAAAIKTVTSGGSVTATAYSDTAMTTSVGTSTTSPTSPLKGLGAGVIKAPSDVLGAATQGSTVDSFSANI